LFLAQHHGVPTRLLDWSINPLISLFFAVSSDNDCDGVLYAIRYEKSVKCDKKAPFELKKAIVVRPKSVTSRITRQSGIFTIHPTTEVAVETKTFPNIEKILIPKKNKNEILFKLNQYGINYSTIFPDLDGLGKHICWHIENMNYWDSSFFEE
jgi:hypothetical protein